MTGHRRVALIEKRRLSRGVTRLVFADVTGRPLERYSPGAHVTLTLPNGLVRSYSLTDDGSDGVYAIAVQHEPEGRGGSAYLCTQAMVGDQFDISDPANAFALNDAEDYLIVAGGIGITPLRAMRRALLTRPDARVRLLYLTRDHDDAAFADELAEIPGTVIHSSSRNGRLDLWPYLEEPGSTHIYCCGSPALMESVRMLSIHWNPRHVHFEDFAGPKAGPADLACEVVWEPTGQRVHVPADTTILDALQRAAIPTRSSCLTGTCGTCILRVTAGEPDHRDVRLDDAERSTSILPCVSRANSDALHLRPVP